MADYCAQADLERAAGGAARLVRLADQDTTGVVDSAVITAAIDDASRWIDSYLARRYTVPLETPSDIIRRLTSEEALYILRSQAGTLDDDARLKHDQLDTWLERVSKGEVNPGVDPPPAKSSAVTASTGHREDITETTTRAASVTRTKLERFI